MPAPQRLVAPLSCLVLAIQGLTGCTPAPVHPGEPTDAEAPPSTPYLPSTARAAGDESEEDAKAWDVDAPPGTAKKVPIDVRSGTWMSLDVSPDGTEIVFDLLGDIYTMPITGGEATPLTEGMAWDMQPTYSPDGQVIAFTSDRGGGDNIWVMRRDGSEPRPITDEKFRLLNSPAWSPDGQYVVARKHFTGTRSLGSGEMWLYHVSGGAGVRMTDKPNDQQDVGEPAFSPDGRHLYFSQDVTPGPYFEYNKDPHAGIYAIKRLDRAEQRTETVVRGAGGACRPTPSPDGKKLAHVRRVGLDTALFVLDLESGRQRIVYEGLERDMQETWAIHGVYPRMDWTPGGDSIVFWAGGKLMRVNVESGEAKEIPFHVKHEREVREALKVPVEVHPERFDTRMLRWAEVAPDGKSVVYSALGHLYVRELPEGQPRRLTRDEAFEFYPSFSRDGRSIVYTTWDDEKLGSVRVVSARGGEGRVLTTHPGHYVEPVFTPDGRSVVYRKASGGYITSGLWARDPGLYVTSARGSKGAEPLRLTRSGSAPHFGAGSDRVYYVDSAGEDGRLLKSIGLDGREPLDHVKFDKASRIRVSPDGKWLAFQELFQAYVAPFPAIGKVWDLGPDSKSVPVARVSRDAGEYLHWAGDSGSLHWSLGPELFTRPLGDSFDFVRGTPATEQNPLPAAPDHGINIGFSVASARTEGKVALVGGKVVTMKGDEVIDGGVVVIDGDRIAAVGPAGTPIPADAAQIDVSGHTVVPGLIDVHAHGPQGELGFIPQQNWLHYATLAFGVTTVHDPSNDTEEIFTAAEMARAGQILAPRIFSTGTILYGAETPFMAKVDSLEDARTHLRRMAAVGAISVKSYNQPRREQRQQVMQAARELGVMVVPEGGSLFMHNMTMVVDGHTGVEHALPVANTYDDVRQLWSATDVGYTPTLVVGYGGLSGEYYWYAKTDVHAHPRLTAFVPAFAYEGRARRRVTASDGDWNHIRIAAHCKQLRDAGVRVQIGAHGQREGLAAHWEMWMLEQGGMTPHEVLRAATIDGAYYLGLQGDLGSIEPGKLADLAVIEGDVLADLRQSDRVKYTVLGGRVFDAATMNETITGDERRAPFFWEQGGADGPAGARGVSVPHSTHADGD